MWMNDVENRIAQHGLTPRWLDSAGQHYIEYADDDYRYKVWIEDAKSLGLKVELANKYQLAGVAAWRKGFEKEGIWSTIQLALGQPASPAAVDPFAAELADWSLKSLMQKANSWKRKGHPSENRNRIVVSVATVGQPGCRGGDGRLCTDG